MKMVLEVAGHRSNAPISRSCPGSCSPVSEPSFGPAQAPPRPRWGSLLPVACAGHSVPRGEGSQSAAGVLLRSPASSASHGDSVAG